MEGLKFKTIDMFNLEFTVSKVSNGFTVSIGGSTYIFQTAAEVLHFISSEVI